MGRVSWKYKSTPRPKEIQGSAGCKLGLKDIHDLPWLTTELSGFIDKKESWLEVLGLTP